MQVNQASSSALLNRPSTSAVGTRDLSEIFQSEELSYFKSHSDCLQKNLQSINQVAQSLFQNRTVQGSTDDSAGAFLVEQVKSLQ